MIFTYNMICTAQHFVAVTVPVVIKVYLCFNKAAFSTLALSTKTCSPYKQEYKGGDCWCLVWASFHHILLNSETNAEVIFSQGVRLDRDTIFKSFPVEWEFQDKIPLLDAYIIFSYCVFHKMCMCMF